MSDSAQYALRERLKQWFVQKDVAQKEYAALHVKVDPRRLRPSLEALPLWHRY